MPRVSFTGHLRRDLPVASVDVPGDTVAVALDAVFANEPRLRGYVLDDQGAVRKHVALFINGERATLRDPVTARDEIYVLQALSGG
jgi:molybdopterin synthase sulfur carrier subunit